MTKKDNNIQNFTFNNNIKLDDLPGYITHYISEKEKILAAYKTSKDHSVFTDSKLIIFDNELGKKQIYSIFYKSISLIDLLFEEKSAYITINLESGVQIKIDFEDILPQDKVRLRILYTCITSKISNFKISKKDIKKLIRNNF